MASAELSADGLLEAAQHLLPTGRGRPRNARLRRAISTAYYAVFVALTIEASFHYPDGAAKNAVRRLVSHTAARAACRDLARRGSVRWLHGNPRCHPELLAFADGFDSLHLLRHLADYDHDYSCTKLDAVAAWKSGSGLPLLRRDDYSCTKLDAVAALGRAEAAIEALSSARQHCPEQLDILCVAALADDRGRTRITKR